MWSLFALSSVAFSASPQLAAPRGLTSIRMLAFRSLYGEETPVIQDAYTTDASTDLIEQLFSSKEVLATDAQKKKCGACTLCTCGEKKSRAVTPRMLADHNKNRLTRREMKHIITNERYIENLMRMEESALQQLEDLFMEYPPAVTGSEVPDDIFG